MTNQIKEHVNKCWDDNKYNVQHGTQDALKRSPSLFHVAVEINNSIFEDKTTHKMFPYCLDALRFLTSSRNINCFAFTELKLNDAIEFTETQLSPFGIQFLYINENPYMTDRTKSICKPYYDFMIDFKCGFVPKLEWYWFYQIMRVSDQVLEVKNKNIEIPRHPRTQAHGVTTSILRGTDQFRKR